MRYFQYNFTPCFPSSAPDLARTRQHSPHSLYLPFLIPTAALLRHSAFWHSRPSQENANEPGADWCRLSSPVTAVLHFLPCFFCPLNVFCNFQNFCSLFEPMSPCFAHGVSGFGQLPSLPSWQWWVCHHCLSRLPSSVSSLHFAPLLLGQFSLPRLHFWPPSVIWSLQQPGPVGVFQ